MVTIKQIASRDTFTVRQPVLRPGKPVESCIFDGDDASTTVHFGLYEDEHLEGVASLFKVSNDSFNETVQYQLRGMAVQANNRGKGFGDLLLSAVEAYAQEQSTALIWFNAREIAVDFYEKAGYQKQGGPFTIPDIGPHYIMYKKL